ncbi:type II restriction endonuclease subunit M (plasmid) [Halorubrum sp. BOL3-1]|uniref:Eco57I restriction-modification methylase domain-containing protein n=1 Tax=Halorubrum sp. BOL3-1 TaxID=2497325 RepID=UPI001004F968|nr:DNA methyltransferase [Halorubrum sp. BOL3-1]QAU14563.1 type II restriction endonuclease subunit M [Halorubrum sp. BOL3-1]
MEQQITAADVAGWTSLKDISTSLQKRGLVPREDLGEDDELVMELDEDQFVSIIEAGPTQDAKSFTNRMTYRRHTNLVSTNEFEEFTFISRRRSFGEAGRISYQQFSFNRSDFEDGGSHFSVLDKLNEIEYGDGQSVQALYDTREVVKEFYTKFESLRTDLVTEVAGIPDDRGDAKQRYVQVLMDRLIFLYFIQKNNLLNFNTDYLLEKHTEYVDEGEDVYEEFFNPLFFEVLADNKQAEGFGTVPYLNGGLFSTTPVEEEFPEVTLGETTEETNELFGEILEFLDEWNWHVDEQLDIVEPKNLSPEILGHIFEQTVNQKEMGAYYTPAEITDYMARETIHPYLLDQLNKGLGTSYESIDELFGLGSETDEAADVAIADGGAVAQIGAVDSIQREHVETLYFEHLQEGRVIDPAVGSGAFLLAAQDVLLDIYLSCLEYFEALPAFERTPAIEEALEEVKHSGSKTLFAKREIILNNLYGVDIDDGAVEICKLRLWLSMVADIENDPDDVEPLPNIDFNIRQGNSLIGYIDKLPSASDGATTFGDFSVQKKFEQVIEAVHKHRAATTSSDAANWRRIAEERMSEYRSDLDEDLAQRLRDAGMEDMDAETLREFDSFHWIVEFAEVMDDGGFDVVIGNPPWEVLSPNRGDFFSKYDERFRTYNADRKDEVEEELLADESIKSEWEEYQRGMEQRAEYFNTAPDYNLQSPSVNGRHVASENDLSALFLERTFGLVSASGWTSLILPGFVFTGAVAKDLRQHLLDETTLQTTIGFENNHIFDQIHGQYRFGILTFQNSGETERVNGVFAQTSTDTLQTIEEDAAYIPRRVLESYSPNAVIFPSVTSQEQADTLDSILQHPTIADREQPWWGDLVTKELHEPTDKGRFVEEPELGDYPIYGGGNIYQFTHDTEIYDIDGPNYWSVDSKDPDESARSRIRQKAFNKGYLKKSIYSTFDGNDTSKSQKAFVNDLLESVRGVGLEESDVLPDYTEYRIGYRNVARATDERTMIAAIVPKGIACLETLQSFRPYEIVIDNKEQLDSRPLHNCYNRIFSDEELFVAVALLNSIPFDFLMRTKIDTHIVKYKLEESQVPRLTDGDEWFEFIWTRATRLNCYGDAFEEMRERLGGVDPVTEEDERRQLRAEIDAAAFHAYRLGPEEMQFVLDDFHLVDNPRLMDREYLEMVSEQYHELA